MSEVAKMDFSNYDLSDRYYAGSERKLGVVTPDGSYYMLKFPKVTAFGPSMSHVSEYLGSRIFAEAGLPAQRVYLGTYKGEQVVACRDFNVDGCQFVPFNDVGESTLEEDRDSYQYEYADIMRMLADNVKLTDVEETVSVFWEMYVIDALLGNFDRHGANWGFLKRGGAYSIAPVFDNGSCLFPRLAEEDLEGVLASEEEMLKRVYGFPTSQIRLDGRKSSYYEVITSCRFPECNKAVRALARRLDMEKVMAIVDGVKFASETRRRFYREMLALRWERIVLDACGRIGEE